MGEAIHTSVYILNRIGTKVLKGKSPLEALHQSYESS
jgi:hypothetical protein